MFSTNIRNIIHIRLNEDSALSFKSFLHFLQLILHIWKVLGFLQSAISHQRGSSHVFGQANFASVLVQSTNLHQYFSTQVTGQIIFAFGSLQSNFLQ